MLSIHEAEGLDGRIISIGYQKKSILFFTHNKNHLASLKQDKSLTPLLKDGISLFQSEFDYIHRLSTQSLRPQQKQKYIPLMYKKAIIDNKKIWENANAILTKLCKKYDCIMKEDMIKFFFCFENIYDNCLIRKAFIELLISGKIFSYVNLKIIYQVCMGDEEIKKIYFDTVMKNKDDGVFISRKYSYNNYILDMMFSIIQERDSVHHIDINNYLKLYFNDSSYEFSNMMLISNYTIFQKYNYYDISNMIIYRLLNNPKTIVVNNVNSIICDKHFNNYYELINEYGIIKNLVTKRINNQKDECMFNLTLKHVYENDIKILKTKDLDIKKMINDYKESIGYKKELLEQNIHNIKFNIIKENTSDFTYDDIQSFPCYNDYGNTYTHVCNQIIGEALSELLIHEGNSQIVDFKMKYTNFTKIYKKYLDNALENPKCITFLSDVDIKIDSDGPISPWTCCNFDNEGPTTYYKEYLKCSRPFMVTMLFYSLNSCNILDIADDIVIHSFSQRVVDRIESQSKKNNNVRRNIIWLINKISCTELIEVYYHFEINEEKQEKLIDYILDDTHNDIPKYSQLINPMHPSTIIKLSHKGWKKMRLIDYVEHLFDINAEVLNMYQMYIKKYNITPKKSRSPKKSVNLTRSQKNNGNTITLDNFRKTSFHINMMKKEIMRNKLIDEHKAKYFGPHAVWRSTEKSESKVEEDIADTMPLKMFESDSDSDSD